MMLVTVIVMLRVRRLIRIMLVRFTPAVLPGGTLTSVSPEALSFTLASCPKLYHPNLLKTDTATVFRDNPFMILPCSSILAPCSNGKGS